MVRLLLLVRILGGGGVLGLKERRWGWGANGPGCYPNSAVIPMAAQTPSPCSKRTRTHCALRCFNASPPPPPASRARAEQSAAAALPPASFALRRVPEDLPFAPRTFGPGPAVGAPPPCGGWPAVGSWWAVRLKGLGDWPTPLSQSILSWQRQTPSAPPPFPASHAGRPTPALPCRGSAVQWRGPVPPPQQPRRCTVTLRYSSMASMVLSFSSRWLAYLASSCSICGKLWAWRGGGRWTEGRGF